MNLISNYHHVINSTFDKTKNSFKYKHKHPTNNKFKNFHQLKNNNQLEDNKQSKCKRRIKGIINPISWDENDRVIGLSIYDIDGDGEDILIENSNGVKKYQKYINKKVVIDGNILDLNKDFRKILVKRITPIH